MSPWCTTNGAIWPGGEKTPSETEEGTWYLFPSPVPVGTTASGNIKLSLMLVNARSVANKTVIVDLIQDAAADFRCIIDTWLDETSGPVVAQIVLIGYSVATSALDRRMGETEWQWFPAWSIEGICCKFIQNGVHLSHA